MALADYSDYLDKYDAALLHTAAKNTIATVGNRWVSSWATAPDAGAAPTTAAALDETNAAALFRHPPLSATTNDLWLTEFWVQNSNGSFNASFMLCDRLSHQGGLSGSSALTQTTNLPTAALTRHTSGVGVMIALEIYSAVGSGATTATASYTNQSGTSGRTTKPAVFGGTNFNAANQMFPLPLQDGDSGVLSVESVTLAGSTATAGNFGVTLYKPVAMLPNVGQSTRQWQQEWKNTFINGGGLVRVNGACLMMVAQTTSGSTTGMYVTGIKTIEVS